MNIEDIKIDQLVKFKNSAYLGLLVGRIFSIATTDTGPIIHLNIFYKSQKESKSTNGYSSWAYLYELELLPEEEAILISLMNIEYE